MPPMHPPWLRLANRRRSTAQVLQSPAFKALALAVLTTLFAPLELAFAAAPTPQASAEIGAAENSLGSEAAATAVELPDSFEGSAASVVSMAGNAVLAAEKATRHALASYIGMRWGVDVVHAAGVVSAAAIAARDQSVDLFLILAIIAKESAFVNPGTGGTAAGGSGLRKVNPLLPHGLMQVAGRWHPDKMPVDSRGRIRVTTPEENILVGTRVLGEALERERGNEARALQRYNGSVRDGNGRYSASVLRMRDEIRRAIQE